MFMKNLLSSRGYKSIRRVTSIIDDTEEVVSS
jgi:hypothetical protein